MRIFLNSLIEFFSFQIRILEELILQVHGHNGAIKMMINAETIQTLLVPSRVVSSINVKDNPLVLTRLFGKIDLKKF